MSEKPVESGAYEYFLDGQLMPIEEQWHIYGDGSNRRIVSTRSAAGVELRAEAYFDREEITGFNVLWRQGDGSDITAQCRCEGEGYLYRRDPGGESASQRVEVLTLYPLMRIFTGPVIAALANAGGEGAVLVPDVATPDNTESLLRPNISVRRAIRLTSSDWPKGLGEPPGYSQWQFIGGQYDPSAQFWLDADNRLLRYCWLQHGSKQWDVRLVL